MPNTPDDRCSRTGKARHRHRSGAVQAAKNHARAAHARGTRAEPMSVYRCRHCAGWHVGGVELRPPRERRPRHEPSVEPSTEEE